MIFIISLEPISSPYSRARHARQYSRVRRAKRRTRWTVGILLGHVDAIMLPSRFAGISSLISRRDFILDIPKEYSISTPAPLDATWPKQQGVSAAHHQVLKFCSFTLQVALIAEFSLLIEFPARPSPLPTYRQPPIRPRTCQRHALWSSDIPLARNTFLVLALYYHISSSRCLP